MMKFVLSVCLFVWANCVVFSQSNCPECEKLDIIGVYDVPTSPQAPGGNYIMLLLTVSEDIDPAFDPHYSDLYFINTSGDTITYPLGSSYILPTLVSDTVPYFMELYTALSNQDFPDNFEGQLVIKTPTGPPCPTETWCFIDYSKTSTTSLDPIVEAESTSYVYPNPTRESFRIETEENLKMVKLYSMTGVIIRTISPYLPGQEIDFRGVETSMIWVQWFGETGISQTHLVQIVK